MELFPALKIGWLNGWLAILVLGLVEVAFFLAFPRAVVKRLFDRSGWSQEQRIFTIAGKMCAFACLFLLTFSPLKIGQPVFLIGVFLLGIGVIGLAKAMLDFRNTPLDEPVTRGIYRISRHPQVVTSSLAVFGGCIAVGSWVAVILCLLARGLEHLGILAEEEVCLRKYGEPYRAYKEQIPRYFIFF
jgi:protein-S-isoprenylcysteine O-methyltransferase Ste14